MQTLLLNRKYMLILLAVSSLLLYCVDYLLLGSLRELTVWFLGNLAFLPLYVMFVTMMIEQVMRERERQAVMRKLNMVIGVFYSEVGNELLRKLSNCVERSSELKRHLLITGSWTDTDYAAALTYLQTTDVCMINSCADLQDLKTFLVARRSFLVGLLENQNLLEHELFTDLLWAVFHLVEELEARTSFDDLPKTDSDHIDGDMKRVFGHLSREWIQYMQHLRKDYPYLFSLAVRLNPMIDQRDARVY